MSIRFLFSLVLLSLLAGAAWAVRPPIPARPPAHVVDLADLIVPEDEQRLEGLLVSLEQATTIQVAILTLDSLEGETIETVSLRTAERWRLGREDRDNGLLFTVALEDRAYRFETGYGLEGMLPDSLLGSLGRTVLVPFFRQKQYSRGILETTKALVREISEKTGIEIPGTSVSPGGRRRSDGYIPLLMLAFLFLLILLQRRTRRPGTRSGPPVIIFPGPWTGGGGFGDGFGGGFGGGGGGFGGGGASGDW